MFVLVDLFITMVLLPKVQGIFGQSVHYYQNIMTVY